MMYTYVTRRDRGFLSGFYDRARNIVRYWVIMDRMLFELSNMAFFFCMM